MQQVWKRPSRPRVFAALAFIAVVSVALVGSGPAGAATTVAVDCGADPNALTTALASPTLTDGTTLAITGTCTGTFELTHSLTLAGSGGATLDGQAAGTVLTVDTGQTVSVSGLTITGGHGSGVSFVPVGGVVNFGTLMLSHSSVSGNSADGSFLTVGGIENDGTLTLTHSSVSNNSDSAPNLAQGGIDNCALGAACTLTLTQSTVSGNSATATCSSCGTHNARGGITNQPGGTVALVQTSVTDNSATAPGNAIGGILNFATLTVTKSAVTGNGANGGNAAVGGISNRGTLALTNSTVSGNSAVGGSFAAGGILNFATLTATNSAVSGNSAGVLTGTAVGGMSDEVGGTVTLTNSTVVSNIPTNCDFSDPDCALP